MGDGRYAKLVDINNIGFAAEATDNVTEERRCRRLDMDGLHV